MCVCVCVYYLQVMLKNNNYVEKNSVTLMGILDSIAVIPLYSPIFSN